MKKPSNKLSLLCELNSLKQEIEVEYWPGAALIAESLSKKTKNLGMDKNFQETQRLIDKRNKLPVWKIKLIAFLEFFISKLKYGQ